MLKAAVSTFGATSISLLLAAAPAQARSSHTIWVQPGTGTISAAVAQARPGDTLRLKVGIYLDSVSIEKTLTIKGSGRGTQLMPPPTRPLNKCNLVAEQQGGTKGAVEGICALGGLGPQGPDFSKRLKDVHVSDLFVHGFNDIGVLGFNTDELKVWNVKADDNAGYGIARFASVDSVFEHNSASSNGEAGLYMGDSPNADSVVRDNSSDHNNIGIFFRDSSFQTAEDNKVWGNCVGILALNTGTGGTPAADVGNFKIEDNTLSANNKACPASDGPPISGVGVALIGVKDTLVKENTIVGHQATGPSFLSGGIVVAQIPGGTAPSGNKIIENELNRNHPADVVTDGSDKTLVLRHNDCDSLPNDRCMAS
jgi:nitrous oxidase accessory protein NosD